MCFGSWWKPEAILLHKGVITATYVDSKRASRKKLFLKTEEIEKQNSLAYLKESLKPDFYREIAILVKAK